MTKGELLKPLILSNDYWTGKSSRFLVDSRSNGPGDDAVVHSSRQTETSFLISFAVHFEYLGILLELHIKF